MNTEIQDHDLLRLIHKNTHSSVFFCAKDNQFHQLGASSIKTIVPVLTKLRKRYPTNLYFSVNSYDPPAGTSTKLGLVNGSRKSDKLSFLNALYADIDVGREDGDENSSISAKEALKRVDVLVANKKLPPYDVHAFSGRGLYLFWLFRESVPATPTNLQRHQQMQRAIFSALQPLPADRSVASPTQLLRVPGTQHSNSTHLAQYFLSAHKSRDFRHYAEFFPALTESRKPRSGESGKIRTAAPENHSHPTGIE